MARPSLFNRFGASVSEPHTRRASRTQTAPLGINPYNDGFGRVRFDLPITGTPFVRPGDKRNR